MKHRAHPGDEINLNLKSLNNISLNPKHDIYVDNLIDIQIKGNSLRALIDSGSMITCGNRKLLEIIPKLATTMTDYEGASRITTASCQSLTVDGIVHTSAFIGKQKINLNIFIIPELFQTLILGNDFLHDYGVLIDYANRKMSLNTEKPFEATNDFVIPPKTESIQIAHIRGEFPDRLVGVTNSVESTKIKGYSTGHVLTKTCDNTIPIRILNPLDEPIYVRRFTTLGVFKPISSKVSISNLNTENIATAGNKRLLDKDDEFLLSKIDFSHPHLSPSQIDQLKQVILDNREAFVLSDGKLGYYGGLQHRIQLKDPHTRPIVRRPYPMTPDKRRILDNQISDLLENKVIEKSNSEWSSPILLIRKANNKFRFVADLRELNARVKTTHFPLPKIRDCVEGIGHGSPKFFSTFDVQSGYHQLPIHPKDRHLTAFSTFDAKYQFARCPQGFVNSGNYFVRSMNNILKSISYKNLLTYVDDLISYSDTFEDHLRHVNQLLKTLIQSGIKLGAGKTVLAQQKVNFLGFVISAEGISPSPSKISAIRDFPRPRTVKEVRRICGMGSYYRRSVKDYAKITSPLTDLTKSGCKFEWTEKCEIAFNTLKESLTNAPTLAFPKHDLPFRLYTDASTKCVGYVLEQTQDNIPRLITCGGHKLTPTQRNYSIGELELYAVVFAVKSCKVYLSTQQFTIFSDHLNLKSYFKNPNLSGRLERWVLSLQGYNFTLQYKKGAFLYQPDCISRREFPEKEGMIKCSDFTDSDQENIPAHTKEFLHVSTQTTPEQSKNDIYTPILAPVQAICCEKSPTIHQSPEYDADSEITEIKGTHKETNISMKKSGKVNCIFDLKFLHDEENVKNYQGSYDVNIAKQVCPLIIHSDNTHSESDNESINEYMHDTSQGTNTTTDASDNLNDNSEQMNDSIIRKQREDTELAPYFEYHEKGLLPGNDALARKILSEVQYYAVIEGALYRLARPVGKSKSLKITLKQLVVPRSMHSDVIKYIHASKMAANHQGFDKSYALARDRYFYKGLATQLFDYIKTCPVCQVRKRRNLPCKARLLSEPIDQPMSHIIFDILGPLPESDNKNKYACVLIDSYTRFPFVYPMPDNKSFTIATKLIDLFALVGVAKTISGDNAQNLISKVIHDVCDIYKVKRREGAALHSRGQAKCERYNQTIIKALSNHVSNQPRKWDIYVPICLQAYRMSINQTTGMSPAKLLYGFDPMLPMDWAENTLNRGVNNASIHYQNLAAMRCDARMLAKRNNEKAQQKMIERYNKHANHISFEVGDLVFLHKKKLNNKLEISWLGPFKIHYVSPNHTVKLTNPETGKRLKFPYHFDRLKMAFVRSECSETANAELSPQTRSNNNGSDVGSRSDSQSTLHLAESSDDSSTSDEVYEIERVIRSRYRDSEREFLVKWLNYPSSQNSWVKYSDLNEHCKQLVKEGCFITTGSKETRRKTRLRAIFKNKVQLNSDFQ